MRALVCGGRKFENSSFIFKTLDKFHAHTPIKLLIQGGAPGTDSWAMGWAISKGIPCVTMHANWAFYNKGAGSLRNQWMIEFLNPDIVIAFPGGSGTANMIEQAYKAGIEIFTP